MIRCWTKKKCSDGQTRDDYSWAKSFSEQERKDPEGAKKLSIRRLHLIMRITPTSKWSELPSAAETSSLLSYLLNRTNQQLHNKDIADCAQKI